MRGAGGNFHIVGWRQIYSSEVEFVKKMPQKVLQTLGAVLLVLLIGAACVQPGAPSAQTLWIFRPTPNPVAVAQEPEDSEYLVVIDAGHGGKDGGAVGKNGTVEAQINLSVAFYLKEALEAAGIDVLLTRTDENALAGTKKTDMAARKQIVETPGVDVVVSVHMNSFKDRSVRGPMAFHMKDSERGKQLAQYVVASLCEAVAHPLRNANPGDFFMVRESPVPAVLVECGFLSNAEDEALLNDPEHQQKLAGAICQGVLNYLRESGNAPQSPEQTDKI